MKSSFITVIGSTNTDMVIKTPRLPRPGETILGGDFLMNPSGKGANQAVEFANRAASISVTRIGAQASAPYRHEIEFNL